MPGAPTGRACDACRKLKKKCDQRQPSCSRCARLHIACVGSGKLRYKFMGQSFGESPGSSSGDLILSPTAPPSDSLTSVINGFSCMLGVDDPGYDVSIYGPFIEDIPRRLGRNEALDSAAMAWVTGYSCVRTREQTNGVYQACNDAVGKLRKCLSDPVKAVEPETLCAVYMMMIFQGWILRRGDFYAAHGDVLVHLVNKAATGKYGDRFEQAMLVTLQVLVVLVSTIDSSMKPDLTLWEKLPTHLGPIPPVEAVAFIETVQLGNLVKVVRLIQTYEQNLPGLRFAYEKVKSDCERMCSILTTMAQNSAKKALTIQQLPLRTRKIHLRFQNSYAILLHLALGMHRLLAMEGMLGSSKDAEQKNLVNESIKLTEESIQYRPLGSSSVLLALAMAYAVTTDEPVLQRMRDLIALWEGDHDSINWMEIAEGVRSRAHEPGWLYVTNGQF